MSRSWSARRILDKQLCHDLVRDASEAFLEPTLVGLCAGLDLFVHHNGHRRVDCLEAWIIRGITGCRVSDPTGAQSWLVMALLL